MSFVQSYNGYWVVNKMDDLMDSCPQRMGQLIKTKIDLFLRFKFTGSELGQTAEYDED